MRVHRREVADEHEESVAVAGNEVEVRCVVAVEHEVHSASVEGSHLVHDSFCAGEMSVPCSATASVSTCLPRLVSAR